jgi:UDP-N-acetylglucosamine--N-acetylmuramyl-(pentapeptide) pyrophosphoryl-undecaprenol N-acetylglucosamine transferase
MRMIVAGGGTGGHLFPGLAVAEAASAGGGTEVLFVGSSFGIEARVIPRTRFPFHALPIRGLRGRGWRAWAQLAWQLPAAIFGAWRVVGASRSQVVLGVGGYASVPVVLAAWLRGVPSVLLEQNAHPGWANRVLARIAYRVCTTFPDAAKYFPPDRVVQTGNPVRALRVAQRPAAQGFTLLVFGGSQGAHRINETMYAAAPELREAVADLVVIHQTGNVDREWIAERYEEVGIKAEVQEFIEDMGRAYARADLVVCRAGATTVAELTLLGKPSILIPYPFAADDHQRANAEVLARQEAAILMLDRELTPALLASTVSELAGDRRRLAAMGETAKSLAVPDAAARVAEICRKVAEEGGDDV